MSLKIKRPSSDRRLECLNGGKILYREFAYRYIVKVCLEFSDLMSVLFAVLALSSDFSVIFNTSFYFWSFALRGNIGMGT